MQPTRPNAPHDARCPFAARRSPRGFALGVLFALGAAHAPARAQSPCFEAAQNPPVAVQSTSIASGDLDGDGDVDGAAVTSLGIQLLLNQGLGTFDPPVQFGLIPTVCGAGGWGTAAGRSLRAGRGVRRGAGCGRVWRAAYCFR